MRHKARRRILARKALVNMLGASKIKNFERFGPIRAFYRATEKTLIKQRPPRVNENARKKIAGGVYTVRNRVVSYIRIFTYRLNTCNHQYIRGDQGGYIKSVYKSWVYAMPETGPKRLLQGIIYV